MIQTKTLFPGVRVTLIQSQKFKTGCFSVNFLVPHRAETAARNALIPSVLLRGSRSLPDIGAISRRLDELYGASVGTIARKKGETQVVGLYADFIEDVLVGEPVFRQMTELVEDLLFHPLTQENAFDPDAVEGEKENLRNAMAGALNDKRIYAVRRLLKTMCADESYGIPSIGEEWSLPGIGPADLYADYLALLSNARVELFYMGRQDPNAVASALRQMLLPLPQTQRQALLPVADVVPGAPRTVIESMELSQSKLCIGCRMPQASDLQDLAAKLVFQVIFGAGTTSKLFLRVREELSLCYYASASYDKYKGILLISAGIDRENYDQAKDEILSQLDECASGRFTSDDLELARDQLVSQLNQDLDNPGRLEEYYIGQAVQGTEQSIEALRSEIEQVTPEAVRAAAASVRLDTIYLLEGVEA